MSTAVRSSLSDPTQPNPTNQSDPFQRNQAVADKVPAMLSIMFDVMTDANLDSQQRVVEMLKESKVCIM